MCTMTGRHVDLLAIEMYTAFIGVADKNNVPITRIPVNRKSLKLDCIMCPVFLIYENSIYASRIMFKWICVSRVI